jgi:hypothetical protein
MHRQLSLRSRAAIAERCLGTLLAGKAQKELEAQQAEVFFLKKKCFERLLADRAFFLQNISSEKNCTRPFSQDNRLTRVKRTAKRECRGAHEYNI